MKPQAVVLSVILAFVLLAAPGPSPGQQPAKVYRIGWLSTTPGAYETDSHQCPLKGSPSWQGWVEGLQEHGYFPGQNLLIECRYTRGQAERAAALAAELVALKPDLIVARSNTLVQAAKQATTEIPIVMLFVREPVRLGLWPALPIPAGT